MLKKPLIIFKAVILYFFFISFSYAELLRPNSTLSPKEVIKIHIQSKNILDKEIKSKKEAIEKEIEKEIIKAQKEITELKKGSLSDIQKISENIVSHIIENISGDKLNESSIKATVEDVSKKNLGKYL